MKLILEAIKALFRKVELSRTHWDTRETETVTLTFDGNLEGREVVSSENGYAVVKVSDEAPEAECFVGGTFTAYKIGEESTNDITEDMIIPVSEILYTIADFIGVASGDTEFCGVSVTKGIWFFVGNDPDGVPVFYPTSLSGSVTHGELKKLDEKYLPDGVNAEAVSKAQSTANSKMDKTNPVGTGSFSLNRKSGTTVGNYSHAEGLYSTASGEGSHAEGLYSTASGEGSHAECNSAASGEYSHAEGYTGKASGDYSHAEGYDTSASGKASHAEGWRSHATGNYSHAEGYDLTKAVGVGSHAEGYRTKASGDYSHTEGTYTEANSTNQHVQGKFNIVDNAGIYAHIVGNGTSDPVRSNAHTLDWDGNAWYAGTIEGTALILPSSTADSTKRFKITVDDSGTLTATEVTE